MPDKNTLTFIISLAVILIFASLVLFAMGRIPFCECRYIKFWHGETVSSENSQHFTDPYTFTHIIHGLGFYLLLSILAKRLPLGQRMVIAVLLESLWEIFENTDFVIQRYREATISLDYYGDSIINSIGDILASLLGFLFAARLSVRASVAVFILIELLLVFWIRDSLVLNIIMLIYPLEFIREWQMNP